MADFFQKPARGTTYNESEKEVLIWPFVQPGSGWRGPLALGDYGVKLVVWPSQV